MTENINVLKLENGWFIDKDEELKGVELGWESQISQTAKEAFVPSIIQQFFPNHHGVAFYWCRFTPEISTLGTDKLFLHFVYLCFS